MSASAGHTPASKQLQKASSVSIADSVINVCLAATLDGEEIPAIETTTIGGWVNYCFSRHRLCGSGQV